GWGAGGGGVNCGTPSPGGGGGVGCWGCTGFFPCVLGGRGGPPFTGCGGAGGRLETAVVVPGRWRPRGGPGRRGGAGRDRDRRGVRRPARTVGGVLSGPSPRRLRGSRRGSRRAPHRNVHDSGAQRR